MRNLYFKIVLPAIISVILFVLTIFLIVIPHFHDNMMLGKKEMIKELVNTAWSIMYKYDSEVTNGTLTKPEAQKLALEEIQSLRYGQKNQDYFWITDLNPTMIIHPYRKDLNNKELNNYTDPQGKKVFVEFVKVVENEDEGYVDYMWQSKNDTSIIVPKLSFVKIFKPWDWIIGTGIYLEDVEKEIKSLTSKLIIISVVITVLIILLLFIIYQQSLKIQRKRVEVVKKLKDQNEELILSKAKVIESEQKITQSIVLTEEREKERFAKDLHDGLGPILSTCKIYLHTLSHKIDDSNDELIQYTNRANELLDESLRSIKEISNNLSPHILRDYGLSNAINSFIDHLRPLHKVAFFLDIKLETRLSEIIEFTIYRVLTELINNTFKYAEASQIHILINIAENVLCVDYKDNGKGFVLDNNLKNRNKFGLLNIQNRIKKLDGSFDYKTSPENGVKVEIKIDIKKLRHD